MADERLMTPFGFASTADEVLADVDLSGRRAVVTGAASGIGVETARALASVGAAVVLAVRRPEAAERLARRDHRVDGQQGCHRAAARLG
jgi:NAD(P)-dependent dehydrogenase (short-subunit alcohol dehydrogenase family)